MRYEKTNDTKKKSEVGRQNDVRNIDVLIKCFSFVTECNNISPVRMYTYVQKGVSLFRDM